MLLHSIKNFLKKLWHGWTKVIKFVGEVNGTIILTVLLVIIFTPLKGVLILTNKLPIKMKWRQKSKSYWQKKDLNTHQSMSNQF